MRLFITLPASEPFLISNPSSTPNYAALSHTWFQKEVTFQDLQTIPHHFPSQKIKSYNRLKESTASSTYIWNDTCCIDKTNSAEVSEEISSMFSYYAGSGVCYVYLVDVGTTDNEPIGVHGGGAFGESQWFKRGGIGTKATLSNVIKDVTRVPIDVLLGHTDLAATSIARRMSWAADRATTKDEDIAYCLMDLFVVHMSVLYGEGIIRAFLRLQEEIIKYNNDPTISVWKSEDQDNTYELGLLARSPSEFVSTSEGAGHEKVSIKPYHDQPWTTYNIIFAP
ncbi:hypothetical protein K435DRAFT_830809 [Dendrothele bispora CBS 962.96]|uniref:Heterokaryon incompatibility domain-containing protein n=1 Tax=Dendrothele bispora (strain CBS 962.96) TaxID=1314807 RepID=A0A4S8LEA8_DENBC|nr:hypothetical protein K435DRAFT_830809 [Dendrothele bispora CBS 962.96]